MHCKQLRSTGDADPRRHLNSNSADLKDSVGSSRDKLVKGRGIPISIKFKKTENEGLRKQNEVGKTMREATPQIEIGAKRLKVRGPSVLGYEGRLS